MPSSKTAAPRSRQMGEGPVEVAPIGTDRPAKSISGEEPRRLLSTINDRRKVAAGQFHEREYWRSFAPGLHIEERSLFENVAYLEWPPELKAQFKDDGYL